MSQFATTLKVAVDDLLATLPEGYFICPRTGIRLAPDKRSVIVEWSHDHWTTPFTRPEELTPAQVSGQEPLPDFVKVGGFQKVPISNVAQKPVRKVKQAL